MPLVNTFKLFLTAILSSTLLIVGGVSAEAAAKPKAPVVKTVAPKPSIVVKYIYDCTYHTVEVTFKNISGIKDVYTHGDTGYYLVSEDFNFDKTKVYYGLFNTGAIDQHDVFITAPNAGPYGDHATNGHTAATSLCPVWYPEYVSNWVAPSRPVGAVDIALVGNPDKWWRND
jgi:hypothetical protein